MHTDQHIGNTSAALRFQVAQNVAHNSSGRPSGECRDQPLPEVEPAHKLLAAMPLQVGIEAGLLQAADDVHVFGVEGADALVQFGELELATLGLEFTPAALEVVVLGDFIGRCQQVVEDGEQRYGGASPFGQRAELSQRTGKHCRTTDQECEAEQPAAVAVQLDMATMQFNCVVDIKRGFVVGALVAHSVLPLLWIGRCRRRVAVGRHLGSEVFWISGHEGSLVWVWVLGGAQIVACEPSSFRSPWRCTLRQLAGPCVPRLMPLGAR